MPRIAPQFNGKPAAIEQRITMGDLERKLMRESLEKQQTQFYVAQLRKLAGSVALPLGIGFAGWSIGMGITNFSHAWAGDNSLIDNMSDALANTIMTLKGKNSDNSYPTLLHIDTDINRGQRGKIGFVRVFTGSNALTRAYFLNTQTKYEVQVYGNFNANATNINQLSEGWLYIPLEDVEGDYEGSRDYDSTAPMTPTATAWSILGYTFVEWKELGEPISQQWIDYMRGFPEIFSKEQIEAAERLMTQQNENPPYDAEGEGSYHQGEYTNVTIWSIQGLTYAEWVAAGMPVTQEWLDWAAEH